MCRLQFASLLLQNAKRKSLNNAKLFTTHTHTHARSQPDINSPRNVSVVKRIGKRFMHNRNSGNRIRDILMIFQPKLNGLLFSFRLIPRYMSLEMSPCVALFGWNEMENGLLTGEQSVRKQPTTKIRMSAFFARFNNK